MRIVYNQPSAPESDDTEGHITRALIELGHEVVHDGDGDLYLFHKNFNPPPNFTGKKVCWYFDKIWNSRIDWFHQTYPQVDHFFLTDGTWGQNYPKCTVLRQGIGDPVPGVKTDRGVEVAFVGEPYRQRAGWAWNLEQRYGKKFAIYRQVFNRELNNLCASIPIFVAPKYPSDDLYWSNRVYLLVGSGAFLIHPRLKGLVEEWGDLLEYYDTDQELYEKIDYYLAHPEEREAKRKKAYEYCAKHFTYKERVKQLLKCVK